MHLEKRTEVASLWQRSHYVKQSLVDKVLSITTSAGKMSVFASLIQANGVP